MKTNKTFSIFTLILYALLGMAGFQAIESGLGKDELQKILLSFKSFSATTSDKKIASKQIDFTEIDFTKHGLYSELSSSKVYLHEICDTYKDLEECKRR